jgi:hypothetical protein
MEKARENGDIRPGPRDPDPDEVLVVQSRYSVTGTRSTASRPSSLRRFAGPGRRTLDCDRVRAFRYV